MRNYRRHVVVVCCVVTVLLLMPLMAMWFRLDSDVRRKYDMIKEGVTTETEVDSMFGPSVQASPEVLSPDSAQRRGLTVPGDDRPIIVTIKQWWYDDDHILELEIDARGVAVVKCLPAPTLPRSPTRRSIKRLESWFRDLVYRYLS